MHKLARWRRITLSDLQAMLAPEERLQFRRQFVDELQAEGLLQVGRVGDEEVLSMTDAGARWVAEHGGR